VRFRTYFALVIALLVLGLAIFEYANPSRQNRIGPGTLLVISLLLGLRFVFVRQAEKRFNKAKEVPPRPLGLSDESSEHK